MDRRFSSEASACVAAAFAALRLADWPTFTSLVHPDSLVRFRDHVLSFATPTLLSAERMLESNPDVPREVAHYLAQMSEKHAKQPPVLAAVGVESIEQLRGLSPRDVLIRVCERVPLISPRALRTVLGEVSENDSESHVVYRVTTQNTQASESSSVRVVSVHRTDAGWRMKLNEDLVGFNAMMGFVGTGDDDVAEQQPN